MRVRSVAVLALLMVIVLTFTSCITANDADAFKHDGAVSVGIQKGIGFKCEQSIKTIASGDSVTFVITPDAGYKILDFSHPDYDVLDNNTYRFNNVLYPTMIEVYCAISSSDSTITPEQTTTPNITVTNLPTDAPTVSTTTVKPNVTQESLPNISIDINSAINDVTYKNSIIYCFNGGKYANSEGVELMLVTPDTSHHKRINTVNSQGKLTKDGYTLVGWNTKADGSGEHISLGSRCTLSTKGATVLYASWSKWSSKSNFSYTKSGNGVHITSYKANETEISVPAYIDGLKVTAIKTGAFNGIDCQKVILPDTITLVESKAFAECALTTLHFFDTVVTINDDSFYKCPDFSTIYINQYLKPVYAKTHAKADVYDKLILSKDKNIVVFFAGSSMNMGLDAYRATDALASSGYEAVNLGWMAFRNAICQIQIITAFLDKNDILVHAPEPASGWQTFRDNSMQTSLWPLYDNNLDLFSHADIRLLTKTFSSLCGHFKNKRSSSKNYTYDDYCSTMDDRGYVNTDRPVINGIDWRPTGGGTRSMKSDQINSTSLRYMSKLYGAVAAKGAKVYLSYCPFNVNCFATASKDPAVRQGYVDKLVSAGYPVLGTPDDFFYDGSYFHDTEYHLVTKGAQIHTDKIVGMLKHQMDIDGII